MNKTIVWCEWTDAVGGTGWTSEHTPPSSNFAVGFLVHEDDECIELAVCTAPDLGIWNSTMTVPKNMIVKRDTVHMGWGDNASTS